jgi:hypothetical protein
MSFTYSELKEAIKDYTENEETTFVANLPVFIRNCEERILKNVQLSFFRRNATSSFVTGNQYLALPDDYLSSYSLSVTSASNKSFLQHKDVSFIEDYNPNASTQGLPKYYAPFDQDNYIVSPTPDAAYAIELHYFYRPNSITTGADSAKTWLSDKAPFAMLYGSLIEAYTFMKGEPDVIQNYDAKFNEAVTRLKDLGEAKETGDAYSSGLVRRGRT